MHYQALLVTNEWQAQAVPLSSDDLEAWAWTLDQTSSVGFYNSDRAAGASQTHKHMQIVPMQTIAALRGADAKYVSPLLLLLSSFQPRLDVLMSERFAKTIVILSFHSGSHIISFSLISLSRIIFPILSFVCLPGTASGRPSDVPHPQRTVEAVPSSIMVSIRRCHYLFSLLYGTV